jgi:hypothetical protein
MTTPERPYIEIVGGIGVLRCELNKADLRFIGEFTRFNVSRWTYSYLGPYGPDFSPEDFHAVCGDIDIPWNTEEARLCWNEVAPRSYSSESAAEQPLNPAV